MISKFLLALNSHIDHLWQKEDYFEDSFSQIAAQAIRTFKEDILRLKPEFDSWLIDSWKSFPRQQDLSNSFGKPPITLYNDPADRYYIDVYTWWDLRDIDIHDHSFSGAFMVWEGSSFNTCYSFEKEQTFEAVDIGQLKNTQSLYLKCGDITEIIAGPAFIHCVWHYSLPTITFLIRTKTSRHVKFQRDYQRTFCKKTFLCSNDKIYFSKVKLVLENTYLYKGPEALYIYLKNLLPHMSLELTIHFLTYAHRTKLTPEKLRSLAQISAKRFGSWLWTIHDSLSEKSIDHHIDWPKILTYEHRVLMSLLFTFTNSSNILSHAQAILKSNSSPKNISAYLKEMVDKKIIGINLPDIAFELIQSKIEGHSHLSAIDELGKTSILGKTFVKKNASKLKKLLEQIDNFAPLSPLVR